MGLFYLSNFYFLNQWYKQDGAISNLLEQKVGLKERDGCDLCVQWFTRGGRKEGFLLQSLDSKNCLWPRPKKLNQILILSLHFFINTFCISLF